MSTIDYKELYEQQKHLYEGRLALAADLSEQYEEQLIRLTELKEQHEQQLRREADLREQVAAVTFELNQLRKMVFGSRRERFIPVPGITKAELQLALDLDAETIAECKISSATKVEYIRTQAEVIANKPKAASRPDETSGAPAPGDGYPQAGPGCKRVEEDWGRRHRDPGLYSSGTIRKAIHPAQICRSAGGWIQHGDHRFPARPDDGEMHGRGRPAGPDDRR